jgi:hypothetical protein
MNRKKTDQSCPNYPEHRSHAVQEFGVLVNLVLTDKNLEITHHVPDNITEGNKPGYGHKDLFPD